MYGYDEVYGSTLKYFNGDELATNVWISKYCLKEVNEDKQTIYYEKTPVDMFRRIAKEFYRTGLKYNNPLSEDEIYDLIADFKYIIPQGRPMAGIGNKNDITSISNCFVIGRDEDSYGAIARIDQEIMQISKRGGGVGTDLSVYRPENSKVKNAAMTTTGPVDICANRFSNTIREVGQSGRRGALMLSMDITHPDSEKFIDAKMQDGKVTGANISVKIYDEWLKSFIDNPNPNKENERIWKKIIHNAWSSAEPGVLFWSTILKESVPDSYEKFGFKTISTNPCFPSSENLLTDKGYVSFNDLYISGEDNKVLTDDRVSYIDETNGVEVPTNWKIDSTKIGTTERDASNVFLTKKNANVIKLNFKNGFSLKCTPDHHIATKNRGMVEAKDLTIDDEILISIPTSSGSIVGKLPETKDEIVSMLIGSIMGRGNTNDIANILHELDEVEGISEAYRLVKEDYNNSIPQFILNNSRTNIGKFFLSCLFRGCNIGKNIVINNESKKFLNDVQMILHSNGIISEINGETLTISSFIGDFMSEIGLFGETTMKDENSFEQQKNYYTSLINTEVCENEDVYCIKEPVTRSIIVNCITTRRCGEITLSDRDSCRLMLLNLFSYVKNPFTENAYLDFDLLKEHSRKITKLMDNMIDLEIEKVDEIIKKVEQDPESEETKSIELNLWKGIKEVAIKGRRSGIGITSEGDMLAGLGYKYGTKEATDFSVKVHKFISTNVYIESCDLVQRDGRESFKVFDWELEKNNPFINRLISFDDEYSKELKGKIQKGRRNIALLTIAPAGSVSTLTQTTSGIEPLYKPYYLRKRKIDKNKELKADFIDATGDWFQTYFVLHHKFTYWYAVKQNITINHANEIMMNMSEEQLDELYKQTPYYGATSDDVNWVEKVRMQGEIQKFIDHSISATTNIPKETTEETVREIYEMAWRSGCKGMTIYRDGCRDGVLTSTKQAPTTKQITKELNHAKKRPKSIKGKVVKFNNGGEKWVSVVGLLDDEPYEIFTGLLDKLDIPPYVEEGSIIKVKEPKIVLDENDNEVTKQVSRYDFQYKNKEGELITVIGLSKTFREEFWNYAKLISGLLRHNMPIEYVVDVISTLNLGQTSINSWKNGVIRTLKKFIKDDTEVKGEICPNCGDKLVRTSGCIECKSCGYSKCN